MWNPETKVADSSLRRNKSHEVIDTHTQAQEDRELFQIQCMVLVCRRILLAARKHPVKYPKYPLKYGHLKGTNKVNSLIEKLMAQNQPHIIGRKS